MCYTGGGESKGLTKNGSWGQRRRGDIDCELTKTKKTMAVN